MDAKWNCQNFTAFPWGIMLIINHCCIFNRKRQLLQVMLEPPTWRSLGNDSLPVLRRNCYWPTQNHSNFADRPCYPWNGLTMSAISIPSSFEAHLSRTLEASPRSSFLGVALVPNEKIFSDSLGSGSHGN
jgi:hypothetical protein